MTSSSEPNSQKSTYSLGGLLREKRLEMGMDLAEIAADTRISIKVLRAMEDGDYAALPADAFSRGFYALYSQLLELDTEEVLRLYKAESGGHPNLNNNPRSLPGSSSGEMLEFAERPRSMHFSSIVFIIILLLLVGAFFCWYFSWNPATFLSQKLRSYEQNSEQIETPLETRHQDVSKTGLLKIVKVSLRKDSSLEENPLNYMSDPSNYPQHLDEQQ